jgi:hypothetical protein
VGIEKWVADIEKFDENEWWESRTGGGNRKRVVGIENGWWVWKNRWWEVVGGRRWLIQATYHH